MKTIKKYKKYIIIGITIILMLVLSMLIYYINDSDKMNNKGIYNIKYKVFQNEKWSKYFKNGITVGDKKNPIQNIEFNINKKYGIVYYKTYTNEWSKQISVSLDDKPNLIYGLTINRTNILRKKYNICYRTYNKKDKWLNWACDGEISGNKEEPITALEVKIIPKGAVKFEYLKDYNKVLEKNKNF